MTEPAREPQYVVLKDGDIVNVDVTAYIGGVHGDTNCTFLVGEVDTDIASVEEIGLLMAGGRAA